MAKNVLLTAKKIKRRSKLIKLLQTSIIASMTGMTALFTVLNIVYNGGKFSIDLEQELLEEKKIVLYEDSIAKQSTRRLFAKDLEYMDNISINWIPTDIHYEAEGAHNGNNYIAYTFYIENQGDDIVDYWYTVYIDDVVKNVDEAVRIMLYRNGNKKVYAKVNKDTNSPEKDTIAFHSNDIAILEKRESFQPNETDKFTIVIWLEGDDIDCVNQIIGGEIKLHMEITGE